MPDDPRPFITVTNELFRHPKYKPMSRSARLRVLELWAYCNEFKTDGKLDEGTWLEIPAKERKELDGVWVKGPPGNRECHDYLRHQKSRAAIEQLTADRSSAGSYGAHVRHHERKGRRDAECVHCRALGP